MALDPAVRAFMEETRFATLATINPDGSPQQTVMWYLLDGDDIVMNTARGRVKDRNLSSNQRASICVEDGYRYVTVAGDIVVDDEPNQGQAVIQSLATRYHGAARAAEMMRESFGNQHRVTLRLVNQRSDAHGFE